MTVSTRKRPPTFRKAIQRHPSQIHPASAAEHQTSQPRHRTRIRCPRSRSARCAPKGHEQTRCTAVREHSNCCTRRRDRAAAGRCRSGTARSPVHLVRQDCSGCAGAGGSATACRPRLATQCVSGSAPDLSGGALQVGLRVVLVALFALAGDLLDGDVDEVHDLPCGLGAADLA